MYLYTSRAASIRSGARRQVADSRTALHEHVILLRCMWVFRLTANILNKQPRTKLLGAFTVLSHPGKWTGVAAVNCYGPGGTTC